MNGEKNSKVRMKWYKWKIIPPEKFFLIEVAAFRWKGSGFVSTRIESFIFPLQGFSQIHTTAPINYSKYLLNTCRTSLLKIWLNMAPKLACVLTYSFFLFLSWDRSELQKLSSSWAREGQTVYDFYSSIIPA